MQPILLAERLRIDVAGVPALDRLSFASTGRRILVTGAPGALFEAVAGLRACVGGELLVEGAAPLDAVRARALASAALDPPMPSGWTVGEYVAWSARLAGLAKRAAAATADRAIDAMELGVFRRTKLGAASRHVCRATVVAAALATDARVLVLEDPLAALPPEAAQSLARRVVTATSGRPTVVFAARLPLESPIAVAADEAIVLHGSRVAAQGTPAQVAASTGTYSLRVAGDVTAFAEAVRAHGATILGPPPWPERRPNEDEPDDLQSPDPRPPQHLERMSRLSVELGPLRTLDLLRLAEDSHAVVLELRPIGYAFA